MQIALGTPSVSRVKESLSPHTEEIFQVIWSGNPMETVK
jgi:hypothetical protein